MYMFSAVYNSTKGSDQKGNVSSNLFTADLTPSSQAMNYVNWPDHNNGDYSPYSFQTVISIL